MRRPQPSRIALFIAVFVVTLLVAHAVIAHAKTSSPAPDGVGSDCSWKEAGQHIVIGGEEFVCHCARLTGPNGKQILCRWWNTEALPKEPKKPAPDPKKKPDPKPKPKYGISTGALNHA